MALVMLPCDLPWWSQVQKHLNKILNTKNTTELIEGMQKIHEICNISLDPEEDVNDPEIFVDFLNFLDNDLTSEERRNFLNSTLPNIINRALNLKQWKPKDGLHFSLQQQPDVTELQYNFVSSLIANAFFSTFPKRTDRSHPTLQNFNFTNFFKHLKSYNCQKAKMRSLFHYFDWLEVDGNSSGSLKVSRQVMSSKEWLTIEDWLECSLPLCQMQIKHEGKLERSETDNLQICFASPKIGGKVLANGSSQECINLATAPELLSILLNVEALEDNEVLTIENVRRVSRISDPKHRACMEKLETSNKFTVCCIDAEDYTHLPISQHEEDNILRELNKCLLAFQQKQVRINPSALQFIPQIQPHSIHQRRLSPIGESISSTPPEVSHLPIITQDSCSTNKSESNSPALSNNNNLLCDKVKKELEKERQLVKLSQSGSDLTLNNRRGKFIVLGSSGEHLPVTRAPLERSSSRFSSCESSEDEFHSAKTSQDDASEDEDYKKRYSVDLETPETRRTFAQRLKDALRRETSNATSSSSDSSYAVGISVTGSGLRDNNIKLRRGSSRGFVLQEESLDEDFLQTSLHKERQWINKFKSKQSVLSKKESNRSSDYSFSTEYSSELEEVYEQFSRWLEDPILEMDKGTKRQLDARDLAVVQFAGSLLKRTLSESFAGVPVPLTEGCDSSSGCGSDDYAPRKNKLVLNAKSLSLELARHKHRLAAQLLSQISQKPQNGLKPVSTGNWGCGSSRAGDVQLKVIIQWLAASVAGVPTLVYHTAGHRDLAKLDTVCRILIDRKWSVKDLTQACLRYSSHIIQGKDVSVSLFEDIIGG